MGESVCTKLIWIVCATWCASITWIACITCMGMHALHKLSGLHEQRAICVLDWSLFFFILVFNFTFIWLCSFLSKQKRLKIDISFWYRIFFLRQPVYPWQWQWTHINWIYQKLKHLWVQFCLDVSGRIANCLMRPLLLKMISSLWHTRWCSHLTPRSGVSGEFFYYIIPPTSPPFCNCDNCKCNQWCWWFQRFWWSCWWQWWFKLHGQKM